MIQKNYNWCLPRLIVIIFILPIFSLEVCAQFGPEIQISKSTASPEDIDTADIDGDGDLDVIVISPFDNRLGWHENLGNQSFSDLKIISTDVYGGKSICPVDIDGDGLVDILCATQNDNKVSWFRNLGEGNFGIQQTITTSFGPAEIVTAADFDSDGDMDIVTSHGYSNDDYNTVVFANDGSGIFTQVQVISNFSLRSISIGDIDNDTDSDIVLRSTFGISICENLGANSFSAAQDVFSFLTNSGYKNQYDIIDLNGNEAADIVVEIDPNYLGWYENQGDLTFTLMDTIGFFHGQLKRSYVDDKDGDGDLDVFAISQLTDEINDFQYHFGWYQNNGNGFDDYEIIYSPNIYSSIHCFSDVTGNGFNDLLIGHYLNDLQSLVWLPNEGGDFGMELEISSGVAPVNVVSGDMDGDGIKDILCSTKENRLVIYKGLGNLNYEPRAFLTDEEIINHIDIGDIDNDGDLDIVGKKYIQANCKLIWMENLGELNFSAPNEIVSIHYDGEGKVKIHDINNDGNDDIVFAQVGFIYGFRYLENSGGGQFTSPEISFMSTSDAKEFHPADFDNDGDVDVLAEMEAASSTGLRLFEYVDSTFNTSSLYTPFGVSYSHPVDYNEDGYIDILAAVPSLNQIVWFENLTDGTFSDVQTAIENLNLPSISQPADLDNDGDIDIISLTSSQNVYSHFELGWHENLGNQTYAEKQVIDLIRKIDYVKTDDLDDDGDLDLLLYDPYLVKIVVYENYTYNTGILNGRLFYDTNQNTSFDSTDIGFDLMGVYSSPQSDYSFTTPDGIFGLDFNDSPGSYTIYPEAIAGWSLTTDSTGYTIFIDSSDVFTYDSLFFGFYPDSVFTNLRPELTGGFPRCNTVVNYWIDIANQGTSIPSGIIKLELNESLTFVSSQNEPDSIVDQSIYWHFDSLFCFNSEINNIQVEMPGFMGIGDTLTSVISVYEVDSIGQILFTSSDSLSQELVCAYDPNDKSVTPSGVENEGYIPLGQELEYLIRFQNTGNDTAFTVTIKDQLDSNLDFSSVNPISSSHHPMIVNIDQNGEIEFIFENIMLPDSNVDYLGSQGFLKFRVSQLPDLLPNTPIENTAEIYFDLNPPVYTNTVLNTIECYTIPFPNIFYNSPNLEPGVEGDFSFQWYLDGEEIVGAVGDTLIPFTDGNYSVSVVDTYNCSEISPDYYYFVSTTNLPIINICQNDSVSIFGNYEFESALFIDTLFNVQGFDSLIYQQLIVHEADFIEFEFQACNGDSIQVGSSYFFETVQITDSLQSINGCDSIIVTSLNFYDYPEVTLSSFDIDTICIDFPPYNLPLGFPAGGVYSGPGIINEVFYPENAGEGFHTIYYTVANDFGCQGTDSTSITVEFCLSTVNRIANLNLEVYPNPTSGQIKFEKKGELNSDLEIFLFDSNSRLILEYTLLKSHDYLEIDISNEPSGTYFVHIYMEKEKYMLKLVKQ